MIDKAKRAKLQRIRGWGADLDPASRPGVPRRNPNAIQSVHTEPPKWQRGANREIHPPDSPRTPVFGTSTPLQWFAPSSLVRRLAYRVPQDKAGHWMLLLVGDRLDVLENRVRRLAFLGAMAAAVPFVYGALKAPTGSGKARARLAARRRRVALPVRRRMATIYS
jgi:hypothetical protein